MQPEIRSLIAEIEATAEALGIATSTVSERAGQGGQFYDRLKSGKQRRAWPETIASVRLRLAEMRRDGGASVVHCDESHGHTPVTRQGAGQ